MSNYQLLLCQNSEPGGKYFKNRICNNYVKVSSEATAALCWRCTAALTESPIKKVEEKSTKPRGWTMMKCFVDVDGTVYHKGEEQPELKGTLPATKIEVKDNSQKKKLSKIEKETECMRLGTLIKELKSQLFQETRKTKRNEITKALNKANRELKKYL
jgi:hypothetical protein